MGIFEVERHDGAAAIMVNLVDELTYRVRSTWVLRYSSSSPRKPSCGQAMALSTRIGHS